MLKDIEMLFPRQFYNIFIANPTCQIVTCCYSSAEK